MMAKQGMTVATARIVVADCPAGVRWADWLAMSEGERIACIKDRAAYPDAVGPVPVAPARGAMRVVQTWMAAAGGTRIRTDPHLEPADVFDRMILRAAQRHEASGSDAPFAWPFTPGQVAMARHYQALTERHSAGAVKCSSMEAGRGGGQGEFMDAYLADGREIDALHRRIGTGSALAVRRIRPSARGTRAGISDRALVDHVCIAGRTLAEVLDRHGWANNGSHREALRCALGGALDRMQGYRDEVRAK